MRFFEILLIVFAAIYVAQLVILALAISTLILFLCCLYKRPRESLVLGAGLLLVALMSKPIGMALVVATALGFGLWGLRRCLLARQRARRSRPMAMLPKP